MCDSSSRHIFYCKLCQLLNDYRCTIYWLYKTDICGSPKGRGHTRPRNSFSVLLFLWFCSSAIASYVLSYEICNRHIVVPLCPEANSVVFRDLPQKIITLTGIDLYEWSHWFCDIGCCRCIVRLWEIDHTQMHHPLNASSKKKCVWLSSCTFKSKFVCWICNYVILYIRNTQWMCLCLKADAVLLEDTLVS